MENVSNRETVTNFFQLFSAADIQGATSLLDDSAIWRVMGREGALPISGEMDKKGIADLIKVVSETLPDDSNGTDDPARNHSEGTG